MKNSVCEKYVFTGFGFDVLLRNVVMKREHGEVYPDINLQELKLLTAKELLRNSEKLSGKKLKFLRTFLKLSYQRLSSVINVPASTLRSWEDRGADFTGLTSSEERLLRVFAIDSILDLEKMYYEKLIVTIDYFDSTQKSSPISISLYPDYTYLKEA